MLILQWCKMQIVCLLVLGYVGIVFIREGNELNRVTKTSNCQKTFDRLYVVAEIAVVFDGITACTVNYCDVIPQWLNLLAHFGMFAAYEIFVALLYRYWLEVTVCELKFRHAEQLVMAPLAAALVFTGLFMPKTLFITGGYTAYSKGPSVMICFVCIGVYCAMTLWVVFHKYRNIEKDKRESMATVLLCIAVILTLQIVFPEYLLSAVAITLITISIYVNMENPAIKKLEHYHHEMLMGFATLVENKDDSTGGHIRRSSAYAALIADHLRERKQYNDVITKDFMDNLQQFAPMHDIGKIGIPDAILQKPGRLTDEEFRQMKEHPVIGGRIIRETFGHLGRGQYENMAYEIAMYHHEKWNGKGYPCGLSGVEIPLCARIMAVADVFDAVSAKRCYRDALPLQECYEIIRGGSGSDFDPDVVDAFFCDIAEVERIFRSENGWGKRNAPAGDVEE